MAKRSPGGKRGRPEDDDLAVLRYIVQKKEEDPSREISPLAREFGRDELHLLDHALDSYVDRVRHKYARYEVAGRLPNADAFVDRVNHAIERRVQELRAEREGYRSDLEEAENRLRELQIDPESDLAVLKVALKAEWTALQPYAHASPQLAAHMVVTQTQEGDDNERVKAAQQDFRRRYERYREVDSQLTWVRTVLGLRERLAQGRGEKDAE